MDSGLVIIIGIAPVAIRVGNAHTAVFAHLGKEALADDLGVEEPVAGEIGTPAAYRRPGRTAPISREVGNTADIQVINHTAGGSHTKVVVLTVKNNKMTFKSNF